MGQIKNIKLHIVTDIKVGYQINLKHHHNTSDHDEEVLHGTGKSNKVVQSTRFIPSCALQEHSGDGSGHQEDAHKEGKPIPQRCHCEETDHPIPTIQRRCRTQSSSQSPWMFSGKVAGEVCGVSAAIVEERGKQRGCERS